MFTVIYCTLINRFITLMIKFLTERSSWNVLRILYSFISFLVLIGFESELNTFAVENAVAIKNRKLISVNATDAVDVVTTYDNTIFVTSAMTV